MSVRFSGSVTDAVVWEAPVVPGGWARHQLAVSGGEAVVSADFGEGLIVLDTIFSGTLPFTMEAEVLRIRIETQAQIHVTYCAAEVHL